MMHDELTAEDLRQIRAELQEKESVELPKLLEAVKEARAFGDLSENFEYKAAKQELNKCKSRIRYLQNMLNTAVVIRDRSGADEVGLFDLVTVWVPMLNKRMQYSIVTTMRANALEGRITRESPVGGALMGHRAGETVHVQVRPDFGYDMEIVSVEKREDDGSVKINSY